MTNILLCTGSKRAIGKVIDFFKEMERAKKIEILERQILTKRVLMMKYEELKILFVSKGDKALKIPKDLVKRADNFEIRKGQRLMVKMKTFQTEDPSLRWNLMSKATSFKLKGGDIQLEETVVEENYKKLRTCQVMMVGPPKMALDLKDQFVKERIVDPKTIRYTI